MTGSTPDEVIGPFNLPNPSSHIVALELSQPLTEMSTRNLPGGKGRSAFEAENLTVICVSKLFRKRGNLDVSQPCESPRTLTGITLPSFTFFARCHFRFWHGYLFITDFLL
jgi:hypothetical protein